MRSAGASPCTTTADSLLIAADADVKVVQMILGHATATMTMDLYGHLFSEAPWVAMERMPMFPEPPPVDGESGPGTPRREAPIIGAHELSARWWGTTRSKLRRLRAVAGPEHVERFARARAN